jgi:hypothetical protein
LYKNDWSINALSFSGNSLTGSGGIAQRVAGQFLPTFLPTFFAHFFAGILLF